MCKQHFTSAAGRGRVVFNYIIRRYLQYFNLVKYFPTYSRGRTNSKVSQDKSEELWFY